MPKPKKWNEDKAEFTDAPKAIILFMDDINTDEFPESKKFINGLGVLGKIHEVSPDNNEIASLLSEKMSKERGIFAIYSFSCDGRIAHANSSKIDKFNTAMVNNGTDKFLMDLFRQLVAENWNIEIYKTVAPVTI